MRAAIRSALPSDATETISYRIPAVKRKNILVWFAAFSDHCSLFPPGFGDRRVQGRTEGLLHLQGTVHFPTDKPLPIALIKKIVKARVKQESKK
jgi:uncharacterized protein YdhG (YjbR/CyaY superfamily)